MRDDQKSNRRMKRWGWTLVCAVALGVVAGALSIGVPFQRQRAAIIELERLGNNIDVRRAGPAWLRHRLGKNWGKLLEVANRAHILQKKIDNETVRLIHELKGVEELRFEDADLTDDGLRHLSTLSKLRLLIVANTDVTSDGLEFFAKYQRLQVLDLQSTRVSDDGLQYLENLTKLEILNLSETDITDAGLQHLVGLKRLKDLKLSHTEISDDGIEDLSSLTNLSELWLYGTSITEDGVERIKKKLPNCVVLWSK